MDVGKPKRVIEVEPAEEPVPARREPSTPAPREPVPAGAGSTGGVAGATWS